MSEKTYGRLLSAGALVLAVVLASRPGTFWDYPTDAGPALAVGVAVSFVVLDRFAAYLAMGVANDLYIAASLTACAVIASRLRRRARGLRFATQALS